MNNKFQQVIRCVTEMINYHCNHFNLDNIEILKIKTQNTILSFNTKEMLNVKNNIIDVKELVLNKLKEKKFSPLYIEIIKKRYKRSEKYITKNHFSNYLIYSMNFNHE